ncbi:hypothetical protein AB0L53_05520 [Nonomuraea sp. NPDC052129]|uniref:hypothetical protein n=1 Tax=Nonomuraea sp. NPDC052129 TaxID=3154651 RepID=UPI003447EA5F
MFNGLVYNGGILHAFDVWTSAEIRAAFEAAHYFGLRERAEVLAEVLRISTLMEALEGQTPIEQPDRIGRTVGRYRGSGPVVSSYESEQQQPQGSSSEDAPRHAKGLLRRPRDITGRMRALEEPSFDSFSEDR